MKDGINTTLAIIGGVLGFLFGDIDIFIYSLIIFMTMDYLTGLMVGISNKKLSSEVGFKGLLKKTTILFIIIIANLLDALMDTGTAIRTAVIFYYLSNEGISILENAHNLGIAVPVKILKILKQFDDVDEIIEIEKKASKKNKNKDIQK